MRTNVKSPLTWKADRGAGRRTTRTLIALAAVTALATTASGAARIQDDGTNRVGYRGHTFAVPADWQVVDLAQDPNACVRFDRHALYLGTPGEHQDCPARVQGHTEALLVQPTAGDTTGAVTENQVARTYRATAERIALTASYGQDRTAVQRILRDAGLPVASARAETVPAAPAALAVPTDATVHRGRGFDACTAPGRSAMDAWAGSSPYGAIGVYIGGVNRGCAQPNLTASWVRDQYASGWRFFPLYVGPQPSADGGSCGGSCTAITDPAPQGRAAAEDAARQAAALGFGKGTVLYNDLEHYPRGGSVTAKVLTYLDAWTTRLHALGYRSGAYGSVSSLVNDLVEHEDDLTQPDVLHFARWNDDAGTDDSAIPADRWADHQRIHQYAGNRTETYGGVTINIDRDSLDVGAPAVSR